MGPRNGTLAVPKKCRHYDGGRLERSTTSGSRLANGQYIPIARRFYRRGTALAICASTIFLRDRSLPLAQIDSADSSLRLIIGDAAGLQMRSDNGMRPL